MVCSESCHVNRGFGKVKLIFFSCAFAKKKMADPMNDLPTTPTSTKTAATTAAAAAAAAVSAGAAGAIALPPTSSSTTATATAMGSRKPTFPQFESPLTLYSSPQVQIDSTIETEHQSCYRQCKPITSKFKRSIREPLELLYRSKLIDKLQLSQISKNVIQKAVEAETKSQLYRDWATRLDMMAMYGGILVSGLVVIKESVQVKQAQFGDPLFWILAGLSFAVNFTIGTQQHKNFPELARIYEKLYYQIELFVWAFISRTDDFNGKTHSEACPLLMSKVNHLYQEAQDEIRNAKAKIQQNPTKDLENLVNIKKQLADLKQFVAHKIEDKLEDKIEEKLDKIL